MRLQRCNRQEFYYKNYLDKLDVYDEYGNKTGESEIKYSDAVKAYGNIIPSTSSISIEMFGSDIKYSKTLITTKRVDITEQSVIKINNDNYIIKAITDTIHYKFIAIERTSGEY